MLTRAQIQRLAQRNTIGMQAQERDYVQHLLLQLLFTRSQDLILEDGTALRIVYHGGRYSEDLDFNGMIGVDAIKGRSTMEATAPRARSVLISAFAEKKWIPRESWSLPPTTTLVPSSSPS